MLFKKAQKFDEISHFFSTLYLRCRYICNNWSQFAVRNSKKSSWPVTGLRNRGTLKDLNDSKLIVYESKWDPWSSRINFLPFRIFRGPLFHKPVAGLELFLAVYYSKPALVAVYIKLKKLFEPFGYFSAHCVLCGPAHSELRNPSGDSN